MSHVRKYRSAGRMVQGVMAAVAMLAAVSAQAQFEQYAAPGSLAVPELPTKARLEAAMDAARWNLGPVRVAPWLALKDATYYDDVYLNQPGKQSDVTVSVGVGAAAFLPVGSKTVLLAHALPEYQWWQKSSERRNWNGRYGVGLAGYYNRLTLELLGSRDEQLQPPSFETEVPVNVRRDRGRAFAELEVLHSLFVYGERRETSWRYEDQAEGIGEGRYSQLARDESHDAAGLRWSPRDGLSVSVGVERVDVEFLDPVHDRSASGDGPAMALTLEGSRMGLEASAARFTIDPEPGSAFVPFEGTTGRGRLSWNLGRRSQLSLYGFRQLAFSIASMYAYYDTERSGVAFTFPVGWRGSAMVFAEQGTNDYVGAAGLEPRSDDVTAYGGRVSLLVARSLRFVLGATQTDYTSNILGGDRSYLRVQAGFAVGGESPAVF